MKRINKVIEFNHKAWYRTEKKKAKNDFEKVFFEVMKNSVFEKNMESIRKHRDIKPVTVEKTRNYLVSKPIYHTTKFFLENLIAIKI